MDYLVSRSIARYVLGGLFLLLQGCMASTISQMDTEAEECFTQNIEFEPYHACIYQNVLLQLPVRRVVTPIEAENAYIFADIVKEAATTGVISQREARTRLAIYVSGIIETAENESREKTRAIGRALQGFGDGVNSAGGSQNTIPAAIDPTPRVINPNPDVFVSANPRNNSLENNSAYGLNKVCVYDGLGGRRVITIGASEICPLNPGGSNTATIGGVVNGPGFFSRSINDGQNRVCIYDKSGSIFTVNVPLLQTCPQIAE